MSELKNIDTSKMEKLNINKVTLNGKPATNIITAQDLKDNDVIELKISASKKDVNNSEQV